MIRTVILGCLVGAAISVITLLLLAWTTSPVIGSAITLFVCGIPLLLRLAHADMHGKPFLPPTDKDSAR